MLFDYHVGDSIRISQEAVRRLEDDILPENIMEYVRNQQELTISYYGYSEHYQEEYFGFFGVLYVLEKSLIIKV